MIRISLASEAERGKNKASDRHRPSILMDQYISMNRQKHIHTSGNLPLVHWILCEIAPSCQVVQPKPVVIQPRLSIELLPLEPNGLVDDLRIAFFFDPSPSVVLRRPYQLARMFP